MLTLLITMAIIFFGLGVVYPAIAILSYVIHRIRTGDKDFRSYLKDW